MGRTYTATLEGDRLIWDGAGPATTTRAARVEVRIVDEPAHATEAERGRLRVEAINRLTRLGAFAGIDPVEWQREIRTDPPLYGRND